jgi:ABC-type transport system substrate-binding protein
MLQVISGYWEAIGVKTQVVPMDFTAFRNAWVSKDPKIMGGVATYISFGSAANSIPAQQNHMTSKGVNFSGNDPQLDKDFFAMTAELDANKRLEAGTRSSKKCSRCIRSWAWPASMTSTQ